MTKIENPEQLPRHYAGAERPAGFTYPLSGGNVLFVTFAWLIGPRHRGRDRAITARKFELLNRAVVYGEIPHGLALVPAPLN